MPTSSRADFVNGLFARRDLYVESTAAASLSAAHRLRGRSGIAPEETALPVLTSHGFKDIPVAPLPK